MKKLNDTYEDMLQSEAEVVTEEVATSIPNVTKHYDITYDSEGRVISSKLNN